MLPFEGNDVAVQWIGHGGNHLPRAAPLDELCNHLRTIYGPHDGRPERNPHSLLSRFVDEQDEQSGGIQDVALGQSSSPLLSAQRSAISSSAKLTPSGTSCRMILRALLMAEARDLT